MVSANTQNLYALNAKSPVSSRPTQKENMLKKLFCNPAVHHSSARLRGCRAGRLSTPRLLDKLLQEALAHCRSLPGVWPRHSRSAVITPAAFKLSAGAASTVTSNTARHARHVQHAADKSSKAKYLTRFTRDYATGAGNFKHIPVRVDTEYTLRHTQCRLVCSKYYFSSSLERHVDHQQHLRRIKDCL